MNVEIGTEAVQFPEKEFINGIFVAVWHPKPHINSVMTVIPACSAETTNFIPMA
jgi:hypothetical protein